MTATAAQIPDVPFCMRFGYEDARACWPVFAPLLHRACEHSGGRYAPEHILNGMAAGEFTCFAAAEGRNLRALVFCVDTTWPTGLRIAEVALMGASEAEPLTGDVWSCLIEGVSAWAGQIGAQRLAASGRRGFERRLKDLGMREVSRLYEVDI